MENELEIIAGVDEAGRGPLAGPVTAAAVILPEEYDLPGLNDSKKLTPKRRDILYAQIESCAIGVGTGWVEPGEIDQINILNATFKAMKIALGNLPVTPDRALIDGVPLPTQFIPNEGIVKGDEQIDCIKAASIVAKVERDRYMQQMEVVFSGYDFASNKGYGTARHLEALAENMASPIHRQSFNPVARYYPTVNDLRKANRLGWWGERLACLHINRRGGKILQTNCNCPPFGEIDIVAQWEHERVFTEVKTIAKSQIGTPEEKIQRSKLEKLQRAIDRYCQENDYQGDIRLDACIVRIDRDAAHLKYYPGLWLD